MDAETKKQIAEIFRSMPNWRMLVAQMADRINLRAAWINAVNLPAAAARGANYARN